MVIALWVWSSARAAVYVCVEDGQKVFRSEPCADPAATSSITVAPRLRAQRPPPKAYHSLDDAEPATLSPKTRLPAVTGPTFGGRAIESRIDGEFTGWDGDTIVKLENGQIWSQTEYHYDYHYAYMPKVLIYNSGGGYKMKVEGIEKAVGVEQLK